MPICKICRTEITDPEIVEQYRMTSWDGKLEGFFCSWEHVEEYLNALLAKE
jgi:hypothetical protein